MNIKSIFALMIASVKSWNQDKASHLAAAISFYTIFSLSPLLVFCMAGAGFIFGNDMVSQHIMGQISSALGENSAAELQFIMGKIYSQTNNFFAHSLEIIVFAWGIISLFSELDYCFNVIWKIKPDLQINWFTRLKNQFFSFILLLSLSFLFLIAILVSTILTPLYTAIFPNVLSLLIILDFLISIAVLTVFFSVLYKIIPNLFLRWPDVLLGSFITALLFTLGKFFLSIYITKSNITTYFGTASSIIVILVWIYYSSQILLFGAEFNKNYALKYGSLKN